MGTSYQELAALTELYDEQLKAKGITFDCEDRQIESFMDFVDQYEAGSMNPIIHTF